MTTTALPLPNLSVVACVERFVANQSCENDGNYHAYGELFVDVCEEESEEEGEKGEMGQRRKRRRKVVIAVRPSP